MPTNQCELLGKTRNLVKERGLSLSADQERILAIGIQSLCNVCDGESCLILDVLRHKNTSMPLTPPGTGQQQVEKFFRRLEKTAAMRGLYRNK